jgi:hypothetical protein
LTFFQIAKAVIPRVLVRARLKKNFVAKNFNCVSADADVNYAVIVAREKFKKSTEDF